MGRRPLLTTDDDRALLARATTEALRRRRMTARAAAQWLAAQGHAVSNQTISSAVRGRGGAVAVAAVEVLLGAPFARWHDELDAAHPRRTVAKCRDIWGLSCDGRLFALTR